MSLPKPAIPTYHLYGEPHRGSSGPVIHVEDLDRRSRPGHWVIRPHAHADLSQLIHIAAGGGTMRADDSQFGFDAPCVLIVPAGMVHGFEWQQETRGTVLTLGPADTAELLAPDPQLAGLFARAAVVPLPRAADREAGGHMRKLLHEAAWPALAHAAALRAGVLAVLVLIVRAASVADPRMALPGRHAALVARFRQRCDQRFRLREPIGAYAAAIGASERQLREACRLVAMGTPRQLLDQRTLLEAKRGLLYSNLTVSQLAETLGFADPAHFSRFFARHAGRPARDYRRGAADRPRPPGTARRP